MGPVVTAAPTGVRSWLASGSWPATIVGVVLAMALVLMSPVLIPVVWAIALAVRAYHGLRDWYEVRRIKKAAF